MSHRRKLTVLAVAALSAAVLFVAGATAAEDAAKPSGDPQQVVTGALDEVISILNSKKTDAERRDQIAAIAFAHFDFPTMSKLVVARPWRKFTPPQRDEFIAAFKTHLARSYGRRLARYEGTQVEVIGTQEEQRGDVTVNSKVVGGQFDGAKMDYRMRGTTGTWLVIDVIIEGVSLVSNFRSQFKPILARGGAEELLGRLNDKNDELHADIEQEEQAGVEIVPVSNPAAASPLMQPVSNPIPGES
jgi:phospholipid transport system substrate-binding protein